MKKTIKNICFAGILIVFMLIFTGCSRAKSTFSITFIDVGHGDSALVECDGEYMLIDAGTKKAAEENVIECLEHNEVNHLKYIVMSHTDQDHIKGFSVVTHRGISADYVLCNTETILDDEKFINSLGIPVDNFKFPYIGEEGYTLGSAKIDIIWDGDKSGDNSNKNDSLVILITYGSNSFLFTGDIYYKIEEEICKDNKDIFPVTLIKVPHHGSAVNSSKDFLKEVGAKYAVISADISDNYIQTKDTLETLKMETYVTCNHGDIVIKSTGKDIEVSTEK